MTLKKLQTFFIAITTLLLLLPSFSFAEGDATVTLNPKNPTPNSSVTATLESYSFDVDVAKITWSRSGKVILEGVGQKKVTVQTGPVGYQVPLHVKAVSADGSINEVDIAITPESVDILYETPESYTPLFYEGKSLPGEGALVNFTAIPNIGESGVLLPASSLAYSWYVNDEFRSEDSGIGRSSASFNLDFFNSFTRVKIVVRSPKGTSAEKYIDVYPHAVMPLLYTYDDILGVNYTSLITRRFEATKDFTLALEPFYLSAKNSLLNTATFDWSIDGLPVTPLGGRLLSMQPKENSYGSRILTISIANEARRLQQATEEFNLVFDTRK